MTGEEKYDILIQEAVNPFIVVKGKKRRWFEETEMGDENSTVRTKKKGRKGKGKGKAKETSEQEEDMEEADDGGTPVPENAPEDGLRESIRPEVEELVLAIHKIDSFETVRGKHLVFSAVGYVIRSPSLLRLRSTQSCTSLFACPFPSQGDHSAPTIRPFDFHKPVIDFHAHASLFWVLVDDGWGEESAKSDPLQCVKWFDGLQEVSRCESRSETNLNVTLAV